MEVPVSKAVIVNERRPTQGQEHEPDGSGHRYHTNQGPRMSNLQVYSFCKLKRHVLFVVGDLVGTLGIGLTVRRAVHPCIFPCSCGDIYDTPGGFHRPYDVGEPRSNELCTSLGYVGNTLRSDTLCKASRTNDQWDASGFFLWEGYISGHQCPR